ncbi:general secretion pathway protein GspJ [Mesorhizobium sp. ZC-5]|uniref:general secretion pathway protein GspJ n=1 Tax=Mesorhizobium sp. ZC-5 TaxID=2986066 RepID=UPI0021E93098|nr:general secretion pathway protein GspJ [Mesorhizobium sp. ZC-5]MCV3243112.1 general secretion pathway protein GspJ [Mesorhizobium sp. ZC-5]
MTTSDARPLPPPADRDAGFTLIDMLVALILLAVMSGLMVAFIGQFRTMKRIQTDLSAQMELDALAGYLETSIGNAMPLTFVEDYVEQRISFKGDASELRFVTIARQGTLSFGLRETRISLQGGEPLKTLVQDFVPRRVDETARTAATGSVDLAGNLSALKFQYLSYDMATHSPLWSETWNNRAGLPAAVRITLVAERNGKTMTATGQAILKLAAGTPPVERPVEY